MRKLAATLGTGPATLYWHVRDKDELLSLILDDTFRRVELPADGRWDDPLAVILHATRCALVPRPILVHVIWQAGWHIGPETLRVVDAVLSGVAERGLPEDQVADAYFALITFVLGFVLAETSTAGNPRFGETPPESGEETLAELGERYPNLMRYGPAPTRPAWTAGSSVACATSSRESRRTRSTNGEGADRCRSRGSRCSRTRPPRTRRAIADAVHDALVAAGVPRRERFQAIDAHPRDELIYDASFGGTARERIVFVEITLVHELSDDGKRRLYRELAERLHREACVRPDDVFVVLRENKLADWSQAHGEMTLLDPIHRP